MAQGRFTGPSWKDLLEQNDNNIGDFNTIDAERGLVIERDNGMSSELRGHVVDADHIAVGNDNNLPFSSGRVIGKNDDNELALLRVPELLRAR